MNLSRVYLIAILLMVFAVCANGQETSNAVLVDEHGEIACDDTLGRIDGFFSELRNNPGDSGLVVISGMPENKHRIVFRQTIIEHQIKWRQFDPARIRFLRSKSQETKVQFWRIPPGATTPNIKDVDMSYKIPETVKQFLMGYETKMGDQICPEVDDGEIVAKFMKENPTARVNIVVRNDSPKRARRMASAIIRAFNQKYSIPVFRLRTFTAKFTRPSKDDGIIVEYWYLP